MSRWTDEDLEHIFESTSGKCHLCHKKLARRNYGGPTSARGAWHVDHLRPLARGGADDRRNAKPACVSCNCSKRDGSNRSVRVRHGRSRAPLSKEQRTEAKLRQGATGAGLGALIGGTLAGPPGAWLGGAIGALIGHESDPDGPPRRTHSGRRRLEPWP
jgi:hypothetical protein